MWIERKRATECIHVAVDVKQVWYALHVTRVTMILTFFCPLSVNVFRPNAF